MCTYALGLIGYPLDHSLSPVLHAAALRLYGLAGEYRCYPIPDLMSDEKILTDLFSRVRQGIIHGLNITIPYKKAVIPYLDELTVIAKSIGAVNTIYNKEGRLVGDNTDAHGFMADLTRQNWFSSKSTPHYALVLGAGGAAQAVVYALITAGWNVTLAARRVDQAETLSNSFILPSTISISLSDIIKVIPYQSSFFDLRPPPDLIVNTTPVGMTPDVDSSPWPAGQPFPPSAAVYDLVYNPPKTVFVRKAISTGLPAVNGLGMLIEQAAQAFEIWTGLPAPSEIMRQAVANYPIIQDSR